ncbi:MAG: MGH1-like glycoside hydrolase domain-containing protein [Draconibacterium sp.]
MRGWSGFMALWANIATDEQARQIVENHIRNVESFNAPFGIRTLDKREKMYALVKRDNPSCWLGPIWGISNYMTWKGLVNYGFEKEVRELAIKTIDLFGRDLKGNRQLHEYYNPDTGEGMNNIGFQNWNYLVLNMVAWLEGDSVVSEF